MSRLLPAAALLLALALGGCLEKDELTARSAAVTASPGPDCASCHGYPLRDTNHLFHLFAAGPMKTVNGSITCLDCHATSLASRPFSVIDSIFVDSLGNEMSTYDSPRLARDSLRFVRVDTVHHDRPVRASDRPGRVNELVEYVTSLAHMNGKVDVVFHPRVSDTVGKWPGRKAEFNPVRETCSAVACHPGSANDASSSPHWRFAAPSKGLPELVGDSGAVP